MRSRKAGYWTGRRLSCIVALLLLSAAWGGWQWWDHSTLLLDKSRFIAHADTWLYLDAGGRYVKCAWLSDTSLLFFPPPGTPFKGDNPPSAYRLDTTTGVKTPMPAFDRRFGPSLTVIGNGFWPKQPAAVANCQLSPDGSRVLQFPYNNSGWKVQSLDGTDAATWPRRHENVCRERQAWCTDSRRWVKFYEPGDSRWGPTLMLVSPKHEPRTSYIELFDVAIPNITRKVVIPDPALAGRSFYSDRVVCMTRDDQLITAPYSNYAEELDASSPDDGPQAGNASPPPVLEFTVYNLRQPRVTGQYVVLAQPPGAVCYAYALSPDGSRVLVSARVPHAVPGPPIVQRLLTMLGARQEESLGLWISHLDGSHRQLIGLVPPAPVDAGRPPIDRVPHLLNWLPNGREAGFILHGDLYTVPVAGAIDAPF